MADARRRTELLASRARSLTAVQSEAASDVVREEIVIFSIGVQRVGVRLACAQEVVPVAGMAPIPGAPPWLRGVVQLRGMLVSVLDLAKWWRLEHETAGRQLIVVAGQPGALAILAEAVVEVRALSPDDVLAGEHGLNAHETISSVTRDLVYLLDVDRLLEHHDLLVGGGAAPANTGGRHG